MTHKTNPTTSKNQKDAFPAEKDPKLAQVSSEFPQTVVKYF